MAVQGATRADQRGPDASAPPAPDGAVATVAPPERGLEMQPEETVMHARTRARVDPPRAHSRTRAQTHGQRFTQHTHQAHPHTHTLSHAHTRTRTDVRARTHTCARMHKHQHIDTGNSTATYTDTLTPPHARSGSYGCAGRHLS